MAESNKVLLKINYHSKKSKTQPDMVVEWNIPRILLVVALLIILIVAFVYFLSSETSESEKTTNVDESKHSLNQPIDSIIKPVEEMGLVSKIQADSKVLNDDRIINTSTKNSNEKEASVNNSKLIDNKGLKQNISVSEIKTVSKELKDSRIVRALLTSGLNNKEPEDIMIIPIRVSKKEAKAVYYFTEIINMKGKVLYHHWLRNNKVIFKKKINIFGNRWRSATSKLIIYSQIGLWSVRLVNEEGIVLNEIQFDVIKK